MQRSFADKLFVAAVRKGKLEVIALRALRKAASLRVTDSSVTGH
jgi:hypothetical protein